MQDDSNDQNMLFYSHKEYILGVGTVFKDISPRYLKTIISLLLISSILQQYLLYVSTLPPPFLQSVTSKASAVPAFWLRPLPPTLPDLTAHFQIKVHFLNFTFSRYRKIAYILANYKRSAP